MSTGIRFLEVGARDLGASREFYTGVLRMPELPATGEGGHDDAGRRVARFDAGNGVVVVAVEVGPDGSDDGWRNDDLQQGMRHAGLKVADVDAEVERLRAAGVTVQAGPFDALGDVRIAFFLDPDGARWEFVQGFLAYQEGGDPALVTAERANLPGDRPRFDHVGLTVPDLDATVGLWGDELGFGRLGTIAHHDARGFVMSYVPVGGGVLEAFGFDVPTSPAPALGDDALGLRRVGVAVPSGREALLTHPAAGLPAVAVTTEEER